MPRSFLVKQHDKPQDVEKEPTTLEQGQKATSPHVIGLPPPLLKISPRQSPSLQRSWVATDNRPVPKLVKIDSVSTKKPVSEEYETSIKREEPKTTKDANSTHDSRMKAHLPTLALSPRDLWMCQNSDSRTFLQSSFVGDFRRQMRNKNVGYDVREFFDTNSFQREQEIFHSHQHNANCIEIEGKPILSPLLSGKVSEGGYYGAHGMLGGIYPNPHLYSNVTFYGAKENECNSQARSLPRYYLPHFYPNFVEQGQMKEFRKPIGHADIKTSEEPKRLFTQGMKEAKVDNDIAASVSSPNDAGVQPQGMDFNQSAGSIGDSDIIVSKANVSNEDNGAKVQPSAAKKYRYTCDVCGKSFSRSNTLTTHKRIHTGDKPFHCEQCGRAFRQPGNLTRHRLTHTAVKPYVCPQCNKAFNRASNLHTHMRTHTNYKPFVCDFCGKGFHQKIDMKIHRYTHTGEKPHKCTKCGRGFKQLTHLTYHMRTHSDERLYKCEYCGKGFNQKGNLQAHIYGHTGERPFKCDICDKGFTLASTLNTHKRTHAMKKPFECQFCGKAFYQKNALKTHYIASHPFANGVSLL